MLGRYENFPENVHSTSILSYEEPTKSIQQSILCTFYRLNNETFDLGSIRSYLKGSCNVGFEFGVAEEADFNFLDSDELEQLLKAVDENELHVLDFFFAIRYHVVKKGGKNVPLRFDYLVMRFSFTEDRLEMQIRHEKGTQRVPLDELSGFLVDQINAELCRSQLAPLVLSEKG